MNACESSKSAQLPTPLTDSFIKQLFEWARKRNKDAAAGSNAHKKDLQIPLRRRDEFSTRTLRIRERGTDDKKRWPKWRETIHRSWMTVSLKGATRMWKLWEAALKSVVRLVNWSQRRKTRVTGRSAASARGTKRLPEKAANASPINRAGATTSWSFFWE